ncbi:MAG: signal peptidase I [Thermodesulfobacteriota bacterium]|nr:signal peptidase I [Thermodesulfobacteriota bacterium]
MSSRSDIKVAGQKSIGAEKTKSVFREYAEAIILAVILALFIRTFVIQAFKIPSGSMEPTLLVGDHILVVKSIYGIRLPILNKVVIPLKTPQRGDVIVFIFPQDRDKGLFERRDFIKRVVAVAGETIEVRNKRLYINGKSVPDEHAHFDDRSSAPIMVKPLDNFGPVTVPADKLFVMGDNRNHSHDSRYWGFVDMEEVRGKAVLIYWSWKFLDSWQVRWNRLGNLVP